ncbi:hypothetical protein [Streptomyces sp. NPDC005096]|uniref:LysM peptidoglycan-binding domain-containing protein n=1 Tax=Streptomyces sp. NPDC005096 TaxID=3154559 RepID=UPI0033AD0324
MSGDTLWDLAVQYYGDGNKWRTIYDANRSVIENAAQGHPGAPVFGSSDTGHWIFPQTTLTVPGSDCTPPPAQTQLVGTACVFDAPSGADPVYSATEGKLRSGVTLGHVAWAFQTPGTDQWIFGSTDGKGKNWEKSGTKAEMLREFKNITTPDHPNGGYYTQYRCTEVKNPNVFSGFHAAERSTEDLEYNGFNDNCLTRTVDILDAYAAPIPGGRTLDVLSKVPNEYFKEALDQAGWPEAQSL